MFDSRVHLFANNATAHLAAPIINSDTDISLETGLGALFPSPGGGEIFVLTVENKQQGIREIMVCTARTGDVCTVERAAEGTVAQNFDSSLGTVVQCRVTAEILEYLAQGTGGGGGDSGEVAINTQTGAAYTLVAGDKGKCVERNNAGANTTTVPAIANEVIDVNSVILVRQMGVGVTTIVADTGVTILAPYGLVLASRYSTVSLHNRGSDVWVLSGDATS